MAWATGTITSATPHSALNTIIKGLFGGSGVANWSFVENIPAGGGAFQSGSASYSVDVYKCAGSGTDANGAGTDFYVMFALPTSNADNIRMFTCEMYDATNKKFKRQPTGYSATSVAPLSGAGYTANDTYQTFNVLFSAGSTLNLTAAYGSVSGAINTTGFTYYIKLTKNFIWIGTHVGATDRGWGFGLFDSVISPLTNEFGGSAYTLGATILGGSGVTLAGRVASHEVFFSRAPGVSAAPPTGSNNEYWCNTIQPWTANTRDVTTTNAANSFDLWAASGLHCARIAAIPGWATSRYFDCGGFHGLMPADFLMFRGGGTVNMGDTLTIDGNADWTVVSQTTGTGLYIITRAV